LPAKEKLEAQIVHEQEITEYPIALPPRTVVIVQYRVGLDPIRTVFIPKDEDTPENRAKIIKADYKASKAKGPSTISL